MILGISCFSLIYSSSVKPDQFRSIDSVPQAINDINHHLSEVYEISMRSNDYHVDLCEDFTTELWNEIDSAIQLHNCCVYSYINDLSDDPLSEGQMYTFRFIISVISRWSFNYFFYNKEIRKILFIACTAKSAFKSSESYANLQFMSQEDLLDDCPIDI